MNVYRYPINQPTLPDLKSYSPLLKKIFSSRSITNNRFVSVFEKEVQDYLRVKEVVAVSNATTGLMLCAHAMNLKGKVLVPSFTFNATAGALIWNNIKPVFVDCDPLTFNIDFSDLEKKITPQISAIVAVHVFGNPIDMARLQRIASRHKLKVLIDGAHALGSRYRGRSVGCFADATVFSLAPTKIVTSAEGGLIVTDDSHLAKRLRLLRNYGNPPDYNCRDIGFNARLSEIHAALGIICFRGLDKFLRLRQRFVVLYKHSLRQLPGISYQHVDEKDLSTHNYFGLVIDAGRLGVSAAVLLKKLLEKGIQAKRYFAPPVHKQAAYRKYHKGGALKNTEWLSENILCLPFYSHMREKDIHSICQTIKNICKIRRRSWRL